MIKIISKQNWKTSLWSGGETNEIYIYPEDGNYSERNFQVRISVANTKDSSRSEFTPLIGINRFISILDGEMKLTFVDRYAKLLKQFDIERFSGDWPAYSIGKYTDFNFMTKGVDGELLFEKTNGKFAIEPQKSVTNIFIFVISGNITANSLTASKYDLVVTNQASLEVWAHEASFYYGYF